MCYTYSICYIYVSYRDVEPTKLFKVHCPNKPDFDNLRMDIQKKLAKVRHFHYQTTNTLEISLRKSLQNKKCP